MYDNVFRVSASALNLRAQPGLHGAVLVQLKQGQAIARLNEDAWGDNREWWYVFADTPGAGVFVGYVSNSFLERWDANESAVRQSGYAAPGDADPVAGDVDMPRDPTPPDQAISDRWQDGWHPKIPRERRYQGVCNQRSTGVRISRVVVHITGTRELARVVNNFTTGSASAHYLIDFDGGLHQFVPEDKRAWHAGIPAEIKRLYNAGDGSWRRYKQFFSWSRDYAHDAIYLDASLNPVTRDSGKAKLVTLPGGASWTDYDYFDARWGASRALPIGYQESQDPNNNTIGIEILGLGANKPSSSEYTDAMYDTLAGLITDICERHGIDKNLGSVCGHEDVNPVGRWGWDPNQGFDWSRALRDAEMV